MNWGRVAMVGLLAALAGSCSNETESKADASVHARMVVLGIDGLDPDILADVMARYPERMQNFRWLAEQGGGVHELATSTPPQSPVAWSNFITGLTPGGHGIFDFVHRDPTAYRETIGTQKPVHEKDWNLPGAWKLPLTDAAEPNRSGRAFWSILGEAGIPASVWRMPINYPVVGGDGISIPGMLTPAIDSAYGQPTLFTTRPPLDRLDDPKVRLIQVRSGRVRTQIAGPPILFKDGNPPAQVPLDLVVSESGDSLALQLQGQDVVLEPGRWSHFLPVKFDLLPLGLDSMSGMVRFYLRSIEPELELYASPINIDPTSPVQPVSQPEAASADLANAIGLYYTQGMAEDVNGLKKGLLGDEEFMAQADLVYRERNAMLDYALERYMGDPRGGLLFFYYSTVDLCGHMMWRHSDPEHPDFDSELAQTSSEWWSDRVGSTWQDVLVDLYLKMDQALGEVRRKVGPDTLILVMSDHGFAPYHRIFSLNTWLLENGYLVLKDGFERERPKGEPDHSRVPLHLAVDWSKTRAYGMGFNGLYLNQKGREEQGLVEPGVESAALLLELKQKLEALADDVPERRGAQIVISADLATEVYQGPRRAEAPDIVVGYAAGYGNSDESSLGRIPHSVLRDNLGGTFNGNHLMHPSVVPGTLLVNRRLGRSGLRLVDITAEIYRQYETSPPGVVDGEPFLESNL